MDLKLCAVDGCGRPARSARLCEMHYMRRRRTGSVGDAFPSTGGDARRFESKTELAATGCILWTGGVTPDGYGKFYHDRTVTLAHRWAYERSRGPIPDGLEIDHLCRVRNCVNVEHLEAVTRQVNATRGVGFAGQNARKTHCPEGHPYAGANLYVNPAGGRVCRTCMRAQVAAYQARKRVRS